MTNNRESHRRVDDAPGRETAPVSTAAIAGALQPGDEMPSEANRIYPEPGDPAGEEGGGGEGRGDDRSPLFDDQATRRYEGRWREVQTEFVDDPRRAVSEADGLVAELMQSLARTFTEERRGLEGRWDSGTDVSTEELRIAMRRYRSFFSRLLSM